MWWILLGCATKMMDSPFMMAQERQGLAASAQDYWVFVRWGEANRAGHYLESPLHRSALAAFVAEPPWRFSNVEILQTDVGTVLDKEQRPRTREGTVMVRIEYFDERIGNVEKTTFEQSWVKEYGRWVVDGTVPWGPGQLW